jgi:tRNA (guanine37-N1)-methyltransferase
VKVTILTLFPEMLSSVLDASILGRARRDGHLAVDAVDLRDFSTNKHRTVDDTPAGGGAGMLLRVDVIAGALRHVVAASAVKPRTILVDVRGKSFTQADARRLAGHEHLAIVCGRYEGVDARAAELVDEVLALGDYVLTGGELAALTITDAVARLLPGVLGNVESSVHESHSAPEQGGGLLEHRQYTRPVRYGGRAIPPVLLSGNHKDIARARRKDAIVVTARHRPDLLVQAHLTGEDDELLADARVPILEPNPTTEPDG